MISRAAKQKKQLLRLRPFNMANFSSGSAAMVFMAMIGGMFSIVPTFLLWAGLAGTTAREEDALDKLIRRLNRIVLPICAAMLIGAIVLTASGAAIWPFARWSLTVSGFVGYCSLLIAAVIVRNRGDAHYHAARLLVYALLVSMLLGVVGLVTILMLVAIVS